MTSFYKDPITLKYWSLKLQHTNVRDFPGGVKNLPAKQKTTEETSSIPGLGRALGGGNGNLLQYSCLGNSMDREAWWATVHGVPKSQTPPSD